MYPRAHFAHRYIEQERAVSKCSVNCCHYTRVIPAVTVDKKRKKN